jgi:hypothetical protein
MELVRARNRIDAELTRTAPTADGRWRTYRPDGTEILMAEPLRS